MTDYKPGDWVTVTSGWRVGRVHQIKDVGVHGWIWLARRMPINPDRVRPATPEEIAAHQLASLEGL